MSSQLLERLQKMAVEMRSLKLMMVSMANQILKSRIIEWKEIILPLVEESTLVGDAFQVITVEESSLPFTVFKMLTDSLCWKHGMIPPVIRHQLKRTEWANMEYTYIQRPEEPLSQDEGHEAGRGTSR